MNQRNVEAHATEIHSILGNLDGIDLPEDICAQINQLALLADEVLALCDDETQP